MTTCEMYGVITFGFSTVNTAVSAEVTEVQRSCLYYALKGVWLGVVLY